MKISLSITAIILLFLIFGENDVICKSRGGGSRGGGSRGGSRSSGSRSVYKGGSSGYRSTRVKSRSVGSSSRYNSWSVRVGVSSSVRYRSSSWTSQQRAILMGHIIMSSHYHSRFHAYDQSYYNSISVCYNEEPLYGRNITRSPWFICPWEDPSERFCCGEEVQEKCCRYFDRSGPKAGLIVGLLLILILCIIIYCWYKTSHKVQETTTIVYTAKGNEDKSDCEGATLLVYPPNQYPVDPNFNYNNIPTDPGMTNINPIYPVYPANIGYPQVGGTNLPYPPYPMTDGTTLPYDADATNHLQNSVYPMTDGPAPSYNADTTSPYNDTQNNATAPQFAPSQPPPTYEDALKIKT